MKPSQISMFSGLFFIIAPSPSIKRDVSILKNHLQSLIGRGFLSRHAIAHISLRQDFNQKIFPDIIAYFERIAIHFKPFHILIKDLAIFQHGSYRTIYLDIVENYTICEIFEKTVKKGGHHKPHITIGRKLAEEDFLKAWPYLKDFSYSQHFLCDRITVLAQVENWWMHYKDILLGQ